MNRIFRTALALALSALTLGAVVAPALADTTSVTDANEDVDPDILKLTLENNQTTVVLKQKFEELDFVQVESLYIKWGQDTHYRVNTGNYDEDEGLETLLWLSTSDGDKLKACDISRARSTDKEISIHRVPRSCLPKAPNKIFAKGVATMGGYSADQTKNTDKVARG